RSPACDSPWRWHMQLKRITAGLLTALCMAGAGAHGADFPAKPLRLVVPYPPAGSADSIARLVGGGLAQQLGQPVVVENRAGAGGTIGTAAAARAAPDGYTLLLAIDSHATNPLLYKNLPYDTARDFDTIGMIGSSPLVLVATPNLSADTAQELVTLAKAKPGHVSFGSVGPGSQTHLAAALFGNEADVSLLHVPYRGGGPAIAELLAGHISTMFVSVGTGLPLIRAGTLMPMAIASPRRESAPADVPNMAEIGYPGVEVGVWWVVLAPRDTPAPVLARLSQALAATLGKPEIVQRFRDINAQIEARDAAQFDLFLQAELEK